MRVKEYRGPLGILAAGALGITLLCSVTAMAMTDLSNYVAATLVPLNIVDLAVSNLNTAVALTEQAVTQFVPTATITATVFPTNTASLTPMPSDTPRRFFTVTPHRTRPPRDDTLPSTNPFRTNTPRPSTSTPRPPTNTPIPPTSTPVPPTPTPIPPTDVPPTDIPPTDIPPTNIPPTDIPPTNVPPTDIPPTNIPPTGQSFEIPNSAGTPLP